MKTGGGLKGTSPGGATHPRKVRVGDLPAEKLKLYRGGRRIPAGTLPLISSLEEALEPCLDRHIFGTKGHTMVYSFTRYRRA